MKQSFFGLLVVCNVIALRTANAGPETTLREFAGAQVKKGVRTIGMGGDGATTGNYALVYKDAGGAIVDQGVTHFSDTGNLLTFNAVGFTTPSFWDNAAFYVIAMGQSATDIKVWGATAPKASKPPSTGNLSDSGLFIKFGKPITPTLSIGFMGAFELSQALLIPDAGAPPIRFTTAYRPSGGLGIHWHPNDHWQVGARAIFNHDEETRTQGTASASGLLRSYEYRLGGAFSPWNGTLIDLGAVALDRSNGLEHTKTFAIHPTLGIEQSLPSIPVRLRAGLDETTWTGGIGVAWAPLRIDIAYLRNLGAVRTGDIFGKTSNSVIGTLGLDYEKLLIRR